MWLNFIGQFVQNYPGFNWVWVGNISYFAKCKQLRGKRYKFTTAVTRHCVAILAHVAMLSRDVSTVAKFLHL